VKVNPYPYHKGFSSAYRNGRYAASDGRTTNDCPYDEKAVSMGKRRNVTFSRAYWRAWSNEFDVEAEQ